ncbi:hypothetical protein [Rhizobium sp. Leaf383]|uniref:hypothetical protein n=1 Tax=Rhizobium sp. Leaf383 TaxID=1736357 RepID=UPI0007143347|nr:hypothetical protein [Rhizobium sp. Leaf383]KQS76379.1 hypothetical protein ASG58_11150 [Rhizobium sp. Leaf383]
MKTQWYLGRSAFDPRPNRPYTRVQPLAFSNDGEWRVYDKWIDHFPSEGKVFSPNHPQAASEGIFAFDVTEVIDVSKQDRFRLQTLRKVEEVLDYSDRDPEDVRRIFVEHGIPGRKAERENVVLVLPDDLCVRISLVRDGNGKKSVADLIDLAELPLYSFDRSLFAGERIDGCWYSVPDVTVGPVLGTIDWSLDKDFIASLFKQLKRLSAPEQGELPYPTTKAQIHAFLTTLDRHGLLPADAGPWQSDGSRVRRVASDLRFELIEIEELVHILSSLEPVDEKLSDILEARRKAIEIEIAERVDADVRAAVETRYRSLFDRNVELDNTVSDLSVRKASLEQDVVELADRRDRTKREILSLTAKVTSLVDGRDDARENEVRDLVRDIDKILRGEKFVLPRVSHEPPGSDLPMLDYDLAPISWNNLRQELGAAASQHGFEQRDIEALDLLARSGELVLLCSENAVSILRCYASVVSQGGIAIQSLDPSTIGYDDLWRSPARGAPTTLARAWAACANDGSAARIVLLEGIERTPLDLWLGPLISTLRGHARPRNLLVFLSMGTAIVDRNRSVSNLPQLVVPMKTRLPSELNEQFLKHLLGAQDEPGLWVDFQAKPVIPSNEIAVLMSADFGPSGAKRMPLALRASVAASGTGYPDIQKTVRNLCENLDASPSDPDERIASLEYGREYLRSISN